MTRAGDSRERPGAADKNSGVGAQDGGAHGGGVKDKLEEAAAVEKPGNRRLLRLRETRGMWIFSDG